MASNDCVLFIESNTSGTGALFIARAVHLGLEPILLSKDPNRYSFAKPQNGLVVIQTDTTDFSGLEEVCARLMQERRILGVTSSSEYYVPVAARLAASLGLPGSDPATTARCRSKANQRRVLTECADVNPAFHVATTVLDAVSAATRISYPVVVKPTALSGSVGVRLCVSDETVAAHAAMLLSDGGSEILVEEMIEGPEYSVEVFNGKAIGVTRKHLGAPPYFVETGHDFPAPIPRSETNRLIRLAEVAVAALGVVWGPVHVEARVSNAGPRIIEVNPRLGGDFIPELVRLASGIDLIEQTVRLATGLDTSTRPKYQRCASIRFVMPIAEGTVSTVSSFPRTEGSDTAGIEYASYVSPGSVVKLRGDFRDRVGHAIAYGPTEDSVNALLDVAKSRLRIDVN